jgi:hypothetical protein
MTKPIAPGIYFDMPESEYHADSALGSTDLRRLLASGPDYWWHSAMNPARPPDEPTAAQSFGRALHKLVLEGRQAFDALYEREPDGDNVLRLDADLADWLTRRGVKPARSKAEKIAQIMSIDPTVRIADDVRARARAAGRVLLSSDEYDRVVIAGALITRNPELVTAFEGGMPEVSVFWTHSVDGYTYRLKARFDYLKARGIADLKSIRNSRGIAFAEACRRAIAEHRYDIQAAHYLSARARLPSLVADGCVSGDHDPQWLRRVVDAPEYGFAWVFYQATSAPITWAASLSPGNPITDVAIADIERALATYRQFTDTYGPDDMWVLSEPLRELDMSEMPGWWGRA